MEIKEKIIEIIKKINKKSKLSDEELLKTDLIERGLIDSFQIIEMITEIETEFGINFKSEDLTSEKFKTPEGIIKIIEKLCENKK